MNRDSVSVRVSKTIYVDEDVDVDIEWFVGGLTKETAKKLREELDRQHPAPLADMPFMERLYMALSGRGDLRSVARDILYEFGGRIA